MGFDIDLLVTVKEMPNNEDVLEVQKYVKSILFCERVNKVIDLFSLLPLQVQSRKALQTVVLTEKYDVAILEGDYVYAVLNNVAFRAAEIILRVHNNEQVYFRELALSSGRDWRKVYYNLESYKFAVLNKLFCKRVKNRMYISCDEWKEFSSRYPNQNSTFLPACLSEVISRPFQYTSPKVLFVGSLFMVNNREAIKWYIENVHKKLMDIQGYQLVIAGNTRGESLEWLFKLTQNKNVKIYDSPAQLDDIYRDCSVFINPMQHGAGVKIKTINAIQNGLPIVTTTIGNEGTGLSHGIEAFVADDPNLFSEYVRKLLVTSDSGRELVENAQAFLAKHYNQELNLRCFIGELVKNA